MESMESIESIKSVSDNNIENSTSNNFLDKNLKKKKKKKNEKIKNIEKSNEVVTVDDSIVSPRTKKTESKSFINLKDDYNKFVEKNKTQNLDIIDIIDQKELANVSNMILDFKEQLNQVGMVKAPTTKDKIINGISQIPLIGGIIDKKAIELEREAEKNKDAKVILQEMFDTFSEKTEYLEKVFEKALKLRESLIIKENDILKYSTEIKDAIENTDDKMEKIHYIRLGGIVEGNLLITKKKIYNELDFILENIEELMTNISLMMPGIESGLTEDIAIISFLNNVNDMNNAFKAMSDFSNNIGQYSTQRVHQLITDVAESSDSVIDIEHIRQISTDNKKFMNHMVDVSVKKTKKNIEIYDELLDISTSINNDLITYQQAKTNVVFENLKLKHNKGDD